MDILDEAIIFATKAHSGLLRKGTNTPYIFHPIEAAQIIATITDDREIMAAGVLHDILEESDFTEDDLKEKFGERVTKLVCADSENKRREVSAEESWKVRKSETIDFVKNEATREEKMVVLGDKLSNLRAIDRDFSVLGDKLWERFNQKEKSEHGWYYGSFVELLSEFEEFPVYQEYKRLVEKIFG